MSVSPPRPIRKAVILAAGLGTRMLPATKALPKEALPVVDRPVIHYAVEEAVASGLDQVIIVTSAGKRAIEDYFDRSFEVEHALAMKGETKQLEELRRISELADIVFVRQHEQLGIGHAVLQVRSAVGDEPFVLFLPDDIIVGEPPAAAQLVDVFSARGGSVVAVEEVSRDDVSSYGIVDGTDLGNGTWRVNNLVEKPETAEAPSNIGIVGRYALTAEIFSALDRTKQGKNGELQITDGLLQLMQTQPLFAKRFEGKRFDTGRPLGLLKASVELGLSRDDMGPELRNYLRSLDLG